MWNEAELEVLGSLDRAVRSPAAAAKIDAIVSTVRKHLAENPGAALAWETIPLPVYDLPLPASIRSSWVFILRANTSTGAERHPNSVQRMVAREGDGDFQTRTGQRWESHFLTSDLSAPLERRWISIPVDVWHQGVVPEHDWVVVSFHTATETDLIEEREETDPSSGPRRQTYSGRNAG